MTLRKFTEFPSKVVLAYKTIPKRNSARYLNKQLHGLLMENDVNFNYKYDITSTFEYCMSNCFALRGVFRFSVCVLYFR